MLAGTETSYPIESAMGCGETEISNRLFQGQVRRASLILFLPRGDRWRCYDSLCKNV